MMAAAQSFSGERSATGLAYVVSWFGWHYRISGRLGRCPPAAAELAALGPILDAAGWPQANVARHDLELAEHLPPSPARARGLAHIAFLGWMSPAAEPRTDSRSYARMLLAEQGAFAAP